jgi:hypothetical protein
MAAANSEDMDTVDNPLRAEIKLDISEEESIMTKKYFERMTVNVWCFMTFCEIPVVTIGHAELVKNAPMVESIRAALGTDLMAADVIDSMAMCILEAGCAKQFLVQYCKTNTLRETV